jgi:putative tributyrin esterase
VIMNNKVRAYFRTLFGASRSAVLTGGLLGLVISLASLVVIFSQTRQTSLSTPAQPAATPQVTVQTTPQTAPLAASQPSQPQSIPALRETFAAASLGGATLPYRVLLPKDYATSARRYPVLYLLHGLYGNEDDWWIRSGLASYAARYGLIIVTPGVGDTWYANSVSDERARYEDVIVKDLIPYIDGRYRTLASREGRAIAGLSMGGLAAMKFALRYPDLFVFAGSMSGAFDVPLTDRVGKKTSLKMQQALRGIYGEPDSQNRRDNNVFQLLQNGPPEAKSLPYLYVVTGKNDPLPSVSESNPRFAQALGARKLKYEYHERPGSHDWRFWDAEVKLMLDRMTAFVPQMQP